MTNNDWKVTIKMETSLSDGQGFVHTWVEICDSDGVIKGVISFTRDVPVSL